MPSACLRSQQPWMLLGPVELHVVPTSVGVLPPPLSSPPPVGTAAGGQVGWQMGCENREVSVAVPIPQAATGRRRQAGGGGRGGCLLTPFKRRVQCGIQSCNRIDLEQPPGEMDEQKEGILCLGKGVRGAPRWLRCTWRTAGGERRAASGDGGAHSSEPEACGPSDHPCAHPGPRHCRQS